MFPPVCAKLVDEVFGNPIGKEVKMRQHLRAVVQYRDRRNGRPEGKVDVGPVSNVDNLFAVIGLASTTAIVSLTK